jgi:hypothetical protein
MPKYEYIRETPATTPEAAYWDRRIREGWKLSAIEWKRESEASSAKAEDEFQVPYGLRISGDCLRLEEDPAERQVLLVMLEAIVQDHRLSQVADVLNERGFHTRVGRKWTPAAVFDLLPRLIEAGPGLLNSTEWAERRRRLMALL